MYRKIAIAAAAAIAVAGIGTAALAASGSAGTSRSGSSASSTHRHRHALRAMLHRGLHGEVTTNSRNGYVTHSAVRGTVTARSATTVTVRAADGYRETFRVTPTTRVRKHSAGGQATRGSLTDITSGDQIAVLGVRPERSSADPTARVIIEKD